MSSKREAVSSEQGPPVGVWIPPEPPVRPDQLTQITLNKR